MPIDPNIALSARPLGELINPMQMMQQAQQAHLQQQQLENEQLANQQHQFALKEAQQKAADDDAYKQAIASSQGMTPEQLLEHVRTSAPGSFLSVQKAIQEAQEKAATAKKATEDAAAAHGQAVLHQQSYISHLADQIHQSDYNPVVVNAALNEAVAQFPEWKGHADQLREIATTGGKDALKAAIAPLIGADIRKTNTDAANAAAELPGKLATSAIQTQVAAGTQGGMTPEQQQQARDRAASNRVAAGNLAETQRHNAASESMQDPTNPKRQDALEQQYRTVLQRTISSRSGGMGLEDQKVNQAIHLVALMDQNKDPKTGAYNIPKAQYAELANGLATLISPNGRPTDGMRDEIETRTAKGDVAGLMTYITGKPVTGSTQDIFKMLRDSIDRQGQVAEANREGYFNAIRNMAPTDLADDRRQKLEQSLKLNSLNKGNGQAAAPAAANVPAPVADALKGQKDGRYTLSDGSVWVVAGGQVRKGS